MVCPLRWTWADWLVTVVIRTATGYPDLPEFVAEDPDNIAGGAKLLSAENDLTDFATGHLPLDKFTTRRANDDDEGLE